MASEPATSTPPLRQHSLEETVARYRAVLASTLDPIVTIDACGIIQSASDSIERVFGWKPDEIVGQNVSILMPSPHRDRHDDYLENYRRTGTTNILGRTRDFDAVRRDGTTFPIELSVSRVEVPGQSKPLFTGIIHDISDRRQAELETSLLQRLTVAISAARELEDALTLALREICHATGWDYGEAWLPSGDRQTLMDGPFWHVASPELDAFRMKTHNVKQEYGQGLAGRVLATREPAWISDLELVNPSHFLRADAAKEAGLRVGLAAPILAEDEVVAVLAFFSRTPRAQDDRMLHLVTAAAAPLGPVIQRRRLEAILLESERRFRDMLNRVELLAVMLDRRGRITFVSEYLLKITAWHRQELIGSDWFEKCTPPHRRDPDRQVFSQAIETGEIPTHYESEIITRGGENRTIAWSTSVLRDANNRIIGTTGLGVDVTEQRHIEGELDRHRQHLETLVAERTAELELTHEQLRLADRLASIGTLTAGLGHDMNNVLLPLRCRLDALGASRLEAPAREQLRAVYDSIDYLQQLTDGLQLFALDPDDEEASPNVTSIPDWWNQVGSLLSRAAPKHVTFTAVISDDLPPITVPTHRLTQAVLNLIVNAGEAIDPDGYIQLRISAVEDGRFVRLRVIDNGCGMTPEIKRRVLDPFFTTKKRGLGTGLGLSLVRGVVQSAGGTISIDSEPGRGTIVSLMLPVAEHDKHHDTEASPDSTTITAAVSISDPRFAAFVAMMLQAANIEVQQTRPGAQLDVDIWIVEPTPLAAEAIRQFSDAGHGDLILFGEPPPDWPQLRARNIARVDSFEQIRRTLSDAIEDTRSH